MPNNPHLQYKQNLFIDQRLTVELPAGDWLMFFTWCMTLENHDGASYIIAKIGDQITNQLYSPASLKAAEATFAHAQEEAQKPFTFKMPFPGMSDMEDNRCENCQRVAGAPTAPCPDCRDFPL